MTEVTLAEAYTGVQRSLTIRKRIVCRGCKHGVSWEASGARCRGCGECPRELKVVQVTQRLCIAWALHCMCFLDCLMEVCLMTFVLLVTLATLAIPLHSLPY